MSLPDKKKWLSSPFNAATIIGAAAISMSTAGLGGVSPVMAAGAAMGAAASGITGKLFGKKKISFPSINDIPPVTAIEEEAEFDPCIETAAPVKAMKPIRFSA